MVEKTGRTCEENEEARDSNNAVAIDRISKLPDTLIHHILSLVPTVDAVRTSLLSKRWRRMWYLVPTLQFYEKKSDKHDWFDMFVEQCLIHRSVASHNIANSVVTSLELHIRYSSDIDRPNVNRWSKSPIIQNNIKELLIRGLPKWNSSGDYRPSVALNGRCLSTVELTSVKLDGSSPMNLPSLKSLKLHSVKFDNDINDTLLYLMTACPSLEKFVFSDWTNFGAIRVSSSSLKFLQIHNGSETLHIDALNLQSLKVYTSSIVQVNFSSCTSIRDLLLGGPCEGDIQTLNNQISNLPQLENLTLRILINHLSISSRTLKCFSLVKADGIILNVTTETPNLVSFKYEGTTDLSITMVTPNPQLSGSFSVRDFDSRYTDYWYCKVIRFFSNINCLWNSLSLCFDEKDVVIPERMRTDDRLWLNVKHLKVTIRSDLTQKSELIKVFKWLSPSVERLSIEQRES